jgi:hypothetical protein
VSLYLLLANKQYNVMFDIDLSNNPSTALTAGTSSALTFALVSAPTAGSQSVRSVASVATTAPHVMKISHSVRLVKSLKYAANKQNAPDVVIDRHLVRVDKVAPTPTLGYSDPNFGITYGAQLVIEVPRIGADTPSAQLVMDQVLRCLVMLNPSSNAGLIKLMNNET